jgi:hypothetical protein
MLLMYRWKSPLPKLAAFRGLVVLGLTALCLAIWQGPQGAGIPVTQAQTGAWQAHNDGLYGDRVELMLLAGRDDQSSRPLLFSPDGDLLLRSIDGGQVWTQVDPAPSFEFARLRALVRNHGDASGRGLLAAFRGGAGLAASDDAGATWRNLSPPPGADSIDLVSSGASGRVYAVWQRLPAWLWSSDDGGKTWNGHDLTRFGAASDATIWQVDSSSEGDRIYVHVGDRILRSADDPQNWDLLTAPAGGVLDASTLLAAGAGGQLFLAHDLKEDGGGQRSLHASQNGGDTWQAAVWPQADARLKAWTAAARPGGGRICAAMDSLEILCSDDAAQTWSRAGKPSVPSAALAIDAFDGGVWSGTEGMGLYRYGATTEHRGSRLLDMRTLLAPEGMSEVFAIGQLPDTPAESGRQLFHSVDGGPWRELGGGLLPLGDQLLASPDYATDRRLYSGRMYSEDAGLSWQLFGQGPDGEPGEEPEGVPHVVALGPIENGHPLLIALLAAYRDGQGGNGLLSSLDGGRTWQRLSPHVTGINALHVGPDYQSFGTIIFMTDRGVVFRSEFGEAFEEVGRLNGTLPMRNAYDLAISPNYAEDLQLVATAEQLVPAARLAERPQVFRSADAGASWLPWTQGLASGMRPRAIWLSPEFDLDGLAYLGGERELGDASSVTIARAEGDTGWISEASLPEGSRVRQFSLAGALGDGRLYAAAGPAGVWWRAMSEPVPPTRTPTPTWLPPTRTPTLVPGITPSPSHTPEPTATEDPSRTTVPPTITRTPATSATPGGRTATPDPKGSTIHLPFVQIAR